MLRFWDRLMSMRGVRSAAVHRRTSTSSDVAVPSARTELLLSESLVGAAAAIQDQLLAKNPPTTDTKKRHKGLRAKLGQTPGVIELKT
jgi:hypothetical protein